MERKDRMPNERLIKRPLVAKNLHKEYGEKIVLENETISINPGDKIALVGRNGTGKSSLLRMLNGLEIPDRGVISNEGVRIGYLPQDFTVESDKTIFDVTTEGVKDVIQAVQEFEEMTQNYVVGDPDFDERYEKTLQFLQSTNGFEIEAKIKEVLENLGVNYTFDTQVQHLSGGEVVRLALARILIADPDVLLLDEPTNHLDLEANLWLREFLSSWEGGFLVVSHDRDFLNDITTSTVELDNGKLTTYGGNFDFYKEQKGLESEAAEREVVRLEKEVKKAKKQVEKERERAAHSARKDLSKNPEDHDRFRAHYFKDKATKTAGTKSKIAKDISGELSQQLESARREVTKNIVPILKSDTEKYKGKLLVKAKNVECKYGDRTVIKDADIEIKYGDRIAIFGHNGAGKSTLIKGILGMNGVVTEGEISSTDNIRVQTIDQRYSLVDREKTVLENMLSAAPNVSIVDVRNHLARFLFAETIDVNKKSSVLSGGETARLAMAMITAMPIDLLVLDEPTNNLDISSIEEIESSLMDFPGAILVISHDLSFLRRLGITSSHVVDNGVLKKLMSDPHEGERFKQDLLKYL